MISEEEARTRILKPVSLAPERIVPLSNALGCFSARDVFAQLPLPMFDNSAMDGYAVVANSCGKGQRLQVIGEQPAGADRQLRISPGEAVRIFTGAPIPGGANAVVMQEDVSREGDAIVANVDVDSGEFVRRRGCDLADGQKILGKGDRIRAVTLGLLASQGIIDVAVGGEVSAAVVSTGDELAKPGTRLQPGQIYESNSTLLQALLQKCGTVLRPTETCGDNADLLGQTFRTAIENQILIVSGGVSVGEHDLVQSVLRSLGARIDIWRVAIKPGKPFLFGQIGKCTVFGLPGNPVSAFVTFLQFVRPAILKMTGAADFGLPKVPARLSADLTNDGNRPHYVRGKLEHGEFTLVGRQESHALFGLSQSDALLRVAVGQSLKAGEIVDVQIWD